MEGKRISRRRYLMKPKSQLRYAGFNWVAGLLLCLGVTILAQAQGMEDNSLEKPALKPLIISDGGQVLQITIDDVSSHGKKCLCVCCAFRAARLGISQVWGNDIPERGDIKIISRLPSPCSMRCFQYVVGTGEKVPDAKSRGEFRMILPNGTEVKGLSVGDISKLSKNISLSNWNFIIIRKSTGEKFEVQVQESVFPKGFFPLRNKVKGIGKVTKKETNEFQSMWQNTRDAFLTKPDYLLFENVVADLPASALWRGLLGKRAKQALRLQSYNIEEE